MGNILDDWFGIETGPSTSNKGSSSNPDPSSAANNQAEYNAEAARDQLFLNAIDQYGPYGSLTYARRPDGTPYALTEDLSPEVRAVIDSQLASGKALTDAAQTQLGFLPQDKFQLPEGPTAREYSRQAFGDKILDPSQFADPLATPLYQSTRQDYNSPFQTQSYTGQVNQQSYNPQSYDSQFSAQTLAPTASTQDIAQTFYDQAKSRFQPDIDAARKDMEIKLAQRGIPVGSSVYNDEMSRLDRSANQAYSDAARQAELAAGQEQSRQFGQNLQAGQFGASENQRGMTDAQFAAQFGMTDEQFRAQFGSGEDARNLANQQFASQFGSQENQRAATDAQFGTSFAAGEDARMAGADLSNRQFLGTQQNQQYNQMLNALGFGQNEYQTNLSNQLLERNQPFSEAAALLGTVPNFGSPTQFNTPSANVAAPDYLGVVNTNTAANAQIAAAQKAASAKQNSSLLGSIGQIGAAAAPFIFSDEDMKTDRKPMDGEAVLMSFRDMPVDEYRYRDEAREAFGLPERRGGAMAQDWAAEFGGDGHTIDVGDALGRIMGALKALDQRTMRKAA